MAIAEKCKYKSGIARHINSVSLKRDSSLLGALL